MERIFTFLIGSFVVLHNLSPVTPAADTLKGNVIYWSQHAGGSQVSFPWINPNEVDDRKSPEIRLEQNMIRIDCIDYKNDDPRAFLYTREGILLDILNLAYIPQVCDRVQNYVFVSAEPLYLQQSEIQAKLGIHVQNSKITYLMAGKIPRCVERRYVAVVFPYMANVIKSDLPFVECPIAMRKLAESGASAGGVLNLGPMGDNHIMDYNNNIVFFDLTKEFIFDTRDSDGKSFKLKCTEYHLANELEMTNEKRMATALVVREDNEHVVLDKFILKTCDAGVQGININRRPSYHGDEYRMVFKLVDGTCMERDVIKHKAVHHFDYYDEIVINREPARLVRCPEKWSGDIGLNEKVPFWKILYKRKPFLRS